MNWGTNFILQMYTDFAGLERRMYANLLKENKRAKRLPARLRKRMYGKAKQPYTIIHDVIEVHDKQALKRARMTWAYGGVM